MFFGLVKGETGAKGPQKAIRSVLIVEDEPLVAFDNEHVLEVAGYRVAATVEDYEHALQVIEADEVDLIVADIALHGDKSGVDVARHAHERAVPVLFVTGRCPSGAEDMVIGCLSKPYRPRDLVAAIGVIDALIRGEELPRLPEGLHLFDRADAHES